LADRSSGCRGRANA